MSKQTITQKASDNQYYHRDFHIVLNYGIDYLHKKFGEKAVQEYLAQFADTYYSSLKIDIKEKGLLEVKKHYEKIYKIEDAEFSMSFASDELIVELSASPAVEHIKASGHTVSELYRETVAVVNKTISENTHYDFELLEYNNENGAYRMRFFRRKE